MNRIKFLALLFCFFYGCMHKQEHKNKQLRVGLQKQLSTIDPRKCSDNVNANICQMLFEGLMRYDKDGKVSLGIAKDFSVSEDKKTYNFTLRDAYWSNGQQITAHHFEKSFKQTLSKDFTSVNAYKLFIIKNAGMGNLDKTQLKNVEITALDDNHLTITLDYPCSYFLELLCHVICAPVFEDKINFTNCVSSGPFEIESYASNKSLVLKKNKNYWDKDDVLLEKIIFNIIKQPSTLSNLFDRGELDFIGGVFSAIPYDHARALSENELFAINISGTRFLEFNLDIFPFNNENIRKAFVLSISSKQVSKDIYENFTKPATGLFSNKDFIYDTENAKIFLNEGLAELGISKNDLDITFVYNDDEYTHSLIQMIHHEWKTQLGVNVSLEKKQWHNYLYSIANKNYQVAKINWIPDLQDPVNFLNLFRFNSANMLPRYNDQSFIDLVNLSDREVDCNKRQGYLKKAEDLLIDKYIVLPLVKSSYLYRKNPKLKDIFFSHSGYADFRRAFYDE